MVIIWNKNVETSAENIHHNQATSVIPG